MSVYFADIFATLLNHATKFKGVEIREKVSPVLVSTGDGRNDLKYGSSRKIREIWQPYLERRGCTIPTLLFST